MSIEDPSPDPADDRPVDEEPVATPPARLDPPLDAEEADVLEQTLEVPPPDEDDG
jgi:hypothetical protein